MGKTKITRARYQQMIGRAGRAGFDTHGESIVIVKQQDVRFVQSDILLAPTDRVESQLAEDDLNGLQQLVLSLVSLDIGGKNRVALAETLMKSSLLGQQVILVLAKSYLLLKHLIRAQKKGPQPLSTLINASTDF